MANHSEVRLIAFYLPQYHPIPENDAWWGKGFTEWMNVVKARPRFKGHYQPRIPSELGFYDLRVPEVRLEQAALAREYGISGFCYYHYWFHGKRLLNRVLDEVLASGLPNMNFCLCWANETWRRNWDGQTGKVLIEQTYSPEDDLAHIRWLASVFQDTRYIRVASKPLFIVYRAQDLPDPRRTTDLWREEALRLGIGELYLCCAETNGFAGQPSTFGFDAAVEFLPHEHTAQPQQLPSADNGNSLIFDYNEFALASQQKYTRSYVRHPCVVPGWDNSARRRQLTAFVVHGSTPEAYEAWLRSAIAFAAHKPKDERFVFINAWNEWGESAYLEPDQRFGRQYLEATRRASGSFDSTARQPLVRGGHPSDTMIREAALIEQELAEVNEAVADALARAAYWESEYRKLEAYTLRLMAERQSIRSLGTRLAKEIGKRALSAVRQR